MSLGMNFFKMKDPVWLLVYIVVLEFMMCTGIVIVLFLRGQDTDVQAQALSLSVLCPVVHFIFLNLSYLRCKRLALILQYSQRLC